MSWIDALDMNRALANCESDMKGDWYRDPWGWPEQRWAVDTKSDLVTQRAAATGTCRIVKIDVLKENFAARPAVVLDPIDRLVYQGAADTVSGQLIGKLRPFVYGWRLARSSPEAGRYQNNTADWRTYVSALSYHSGTNAHALSTDITSFFASIAVDRLSEFLLGRCRGNGVANKLVDMIRSWSATPGRGGLPQRSLASCVLASAYVGPLDDLLSRLAGSGSSRPPVTRWMDDVWLFGGSAASLRGAQLDIQGLLAELGLTMNIAKTDVYEQGEMGRRVEAFQHSAVDVQLTQTPQQTTRLDELIDRVLSDPEKAPGTSIKFAANRMRRHGLFHRVRDLAEKADRMPQAADALARLFRASGAFRDLQGWYLDLFDSPLGKSPWVLMQFGTMFPGNESCKGIEDYLAEHLESLPAILLPFGAQRLAAWRRDDARSIIRSAIGRAEHPFQRRALAIAAISAREDHDPVRRWLSELPENLSTLSMLIDCRFKAPSVVADFDPTD